MAIIEDDLLTCIDGTYNAETTGDPTLTYTDVRHAFVNGPADTDTLTTLTDRYRSVLPWSGTVCDAFDKSVSPTGSVLSMVGDTLTI